MVGGAVGTAVAVETAAKLYIAYQESTQEGKESERREHGGKKESFDLSKEINKLSGKNECYSSDDDDSNQSSESTSSSFSKSKCSQSSKEKATVDFYKAKNLQRKLSNAKGNRSSNSAIIIGKHQFKIGDRVEVHGMT